MNVYYATLGRNQGCVEIHAKNEPRARRLMFKHYGDKWSFMYDSIEQVHPADRKIEKVIYGGMP